MSAFLGAALSASLLLTGVPAVGGAQADSYPLTSSTYRIKPWSDTEVTASCAAGFHVRANTVRVPDAPGFYLFRPVVSVHGNYIYSDGMYSSGSAVGTASDGYPEYQAFSISLGNHSWISSHNGWFSWTCDPN